MPLKNIKRFYKNIIIYLILGSCNSELCEALGAIGNLRPSALLSLLPDILLKLKELTAAPLSMEQNKLKVQFVYCIFLMKTIVFLRIHYFETYFLLPIFFLNSR